MAFLLQSPLPLDLALRTCTLLPLLSRVHEIMIGSRTLVPRAAKLTFVRHDASTSRIVPLSIRPIRCSPAAVSWIASDRWLRIFSPYASSRGGRYHAGQAGSVAAPQSA